MTILNRLWRISKYLYYKFLRTEGTPHSIGLAVAIGVFVGCIIPIGIWGQTAVSIIVAIKCRTNPGIAYAATWVSNPYSVIFLYPTFCFVGSKVIGSSLTFVQIKQEIMEVIHNFSWNAFWGLGAELATSYLIGAVIFGVVGGAIGYYIGYIIIKKYKLAKARRRTLKIMKKYKKEVKR